MIFRRSSLSRSPSEPPMLRHCPRTCGLRGRPRRCVSRRAPRTHARDRQRRGEATLFVLREVASTTGAAGHHGGGGCTLFWDQGSPDAGESGGLLLGTSKRAAAVSVDASTPSGAGPTPVPPATDMKLAGRQC